MDGLAADVRRAIRALAVAPWFATMGIATAGLGIAATCAFYSVFYAVLQSPLPYANGNDLVVVDLKRTVRGQNHALSVGFGRDSGETDRWLAAAPSLIQLAFYDVGEVVLSHQASRERVAAAVVSADFFGTIQGPLSAGRTLTHADNDLAAVVIGERLAQRHFGNASTAIGESISLNGLPYTIVGVAGRKVDFPAPATEVWRPLGFVQRIDPLCCGRRMVARMRRGGELAQTVREIASHIAAREDETTSAASSVIVTRLRNALVGPVRNSLLMLSAAFALLFTSTCASIVGLIVSRNLESVREMAVRSALGASWFQAARQAAAEAALIGMFGGILGVAVAATVVEVAGATLAPYLPVVDRVKLGWPAISLALALSVIIMACAASIPMLNARRQVRILSRGMTMNSSRRVLTLRRALSGGQLAVATVLVVCTVLLSRSLGAISNVGVGANVAGVVAGSIDLTTSERTSDKRIRTRLTRILERLAGLPGVTATAASTAAPPDINQLSLLIRRESDGTDHSAGLIAATPGYLRAIGLTLVSGRWFTEEDDDSSEPVMAMSRHAARQFFGSGWKVGSSLRLPVRSNGNVTVLPTTLVGVVEDVRYSRLTSDPGDTIYRPFAQQAWSTPVVLVRTESSTNSLTRVLSKIVSEVDPEAIVSEVSTLDDRISGSVAVFRLRALIALGFSGLAVALATVSVYAMTSQSASTRKRELAIRSALGASPKRIYAAILAESSLVTALGVGSGLAAAYVISRGLSGFLFGVVSGDPSSFGLGALTVLLTATLAGLVPARRAANTDPAGVLRQIGASSE